MGRFLLLALPVLAFASAALALSDAPFANVTSTPVLPSATATSSAPASTSSAPATCSSISFSRPEWTVSGFRYSGSYVFSTPAHQIANGYVGFNLSNDAQAGLTTSGPDGQGSALRLECQAHSSRLSDFFYGELWYDCAVPAEDTNGLVGSAVFRWDTNLKRLEVNQSWACTEGEYPLYFEAYGAANLTLEYTTTSYSNPNWTIGQIYSDREVVGGPIDFTMKPTELQAAA